MSEHARCPIPTPSARSICVPRGRGSRRAGACPSPGSLIGAILGVLASVGGGEVFRARTLLYLGQPFTTSGGGQIQSLATNPKTVSQIIRSEAALRAGLARPAASRSASCAGTSPRRPSSAPGQGKNVTPLVEITVDAARGRKAEQAANSLADSVIGVVSTYVDQKIDLLNKQIASSKAELADIDAARLERRRAAAGGDQRQDASRRPTS